MSEPMGLQPGLAEADRGSLVIADVAGYTSYLLGTELEHAQDVLADLMGVVLGRLQPVLHVSKLEGDAVFAYALDGACGASTLLDTIEGAYFAFRSRLRDIANATSCACEACRQIPILDLKFVVHHGSFVRREIGGNEELTGRDVIVVHRLLKNSAGEVLDTKGYVLLTDACVAALDLDPLALGMTPHVERYDDVGEVACCLEDLGRKWQEETERQRVYIAPGDAIMERSLTVPVDPVVAWDWLTSPTLRAIWDADRLDVMTPGGRQRAGVTNHCVHGPDVIIEHIVDWRPFDYYTSRLELPEVGPWLMTTEVIPGASETTVHLRGEQLTGDRLAAWGRIEDFLLAAIDHSIESYIDHLGRVARGESAVAG